MSETPAKNEFQALIQQVVSTAVADNRSITSLRGVAFFDANKDAPIQSLTSFSAAEMAVAETPDFPAKFGASAATRVALQFVYEYFARINNLRYDQAAFDSLWLDFTAELHQENWITRGVANVRNFQSPNPHIDLGDGVTIRGRNFEELASIGLGAPVLEKLSAD